MTLKKLAAALMIAMLGAATAALPAMAAVKAPAAEVTTNVYIGGWTLDDSDEQVRMEVFDNGTVCYVYEDEPNIGYYYSYFIYSDGSLCVCEGDEITEAYGLMNANELIDLDGDTWTRIR